MIQYIIFMVLLASFTFHMTQRMLADEQIVNLCISGIELKECNFLYGNTRTP